MKYLLFLPAGAGAVIGLFWASRAFQVRDAAEVLRLTLAGTVVSLIALACLGSAFSELAETAGSLATTEQLSIAISVPVGLLLGVCYAVTPIAARGVLSATAPAGQQARVFGLQATFTDVLCILPIAISGVSTQFAGARTTFLFIGSLGAVVFVLAELPQASHRRSVPIGLLPEAVPVTLAGDA
jgi:hypothetical protein